MMLGNNGRFERAGNVEGSNEEDMGRKGNGE
jgi:hypothetical protein